MEETDKRYGGLGTRLFEGARGGTSGGRGEEENRVEGLWVQSLS